MIALLAEIILQFVFEVLVELGFRALAEPFQRPKNPWLASLGFLMLGAIFGGLSLLFFPSLLVDEHLRVANLLVTPVLVGLLMAVVGVWRRKRGQVILRIDRFAYGYLFALAFAVVRFDFAS